MKLRIEINSWVLRHLAVVTLSIAMLAGCNRDDLDYTTNSDEQQRVECSLNINVELSTLVDLQTRSGSTSEGLISEESESAVDNVWILQYDESGTFVGSATYADVLGDKDSNNKITIESVNLLASEENKKHSIVIIANTFDSNLFSESNRSNYSTLDLLKKLNYSIRTQNSDESYAFNYGLTQDDSGTYYIVMSDIVETEVASDDIECTLEYNIAKINIALINNNTTYTPISIQLKAVPAVANYVTNYTRDDGDLFPEKSDFKPTDYEVVDLAEETATNFMFYMPANMRGSVSGNTLAENKPLYADNYNTYIEVIAQDENDTSGNKIAYKFYLGEDLTSDFNISPNYEYKYTLTIDEDIDAATILVDSRISVVNDNVFDYTNERPSNCYILNPSETNERTYYIPVAKRINEFWGGNGYESDATKVINEGDDDYYVTLGWYDYGNDTATTGSTPPTQSIEDAVLTQNITFDAIETAPSGLTSMKVTLNAGALEGNVTVNIVRDGGVLWSWHFWITDYNPNSTAYYKNKYAMTVDGGEIHSYAESATSTDWNGPYAGHFMMDRDIGTKNDNDGSTVLLYQFGRKDPFRPYGKSGGYGYYNVVKSHLVTVKELVENPTNFYTYNTTTESYIFPNEGKYNSTSLVWNDPKTKIEITGVNEKSIFDPSPLGWMLPTPNVWNDFADESKSTYYVSGALESISKTRAGRLYHPGATTLSPASTTNYIAYYPVNGTILSYAGDFGFGSGYDWSCRSSSSSYAYMMLFRTYEDITAAFNYFRWNGRAVRPVTE